MYSARITRLNPTAFIFLIDRSGSMEEKMMFGKMLSTKAEVVAIVTNLLIRELINRCRKEDCIADYFEIAAIGYSGNEASMLLGSHDNFAKPSALSMADVRKRTISRELVLPDGSTVITNNEVKYWIEPLSEGSTPMKSAFDMALDITSRWCRSQNNRNSYPPTIFNITDGEATDGDYESLTNCASKIKELSTLDGKALLININISSATKESSRIIFPSSKDELPISRYASMLYDMSSIMPREYNESILKLKQEGEAPFRAMSLNTSVADLVDMMNIGSRSINRIL